LSTLVFDNVGLQHAIGANLFRFRGEFETNNLPSSQVQIIKDALMEVCSACPLVEGCKPSLEVSYENSIIVIPGTNQVEKCLFNGHSYNTR